MPVLDANFLIRLDHDDPKARAALERIQEEILAVPYQAAFEYAAGTADPAASLVAVAASFVLEQPTPEHIRRAAAVVAQARRDGRRADRADAWIGASALLRGDYVVTSNKRDFTGLGVPAWNFMRESRPPDV